MELTIREIISLHASLSSLDGYQSVVKLEGGEKIVTLPYKFGGKARWNIVKNLGILKKYVEDFGRSRDALINEITNGAGIIQEEDSSSIAKLNQGLTEILDTKQDVSGLLLLTEEMLNLDENQIPITTLSSLEILTAPLNKI